MFKHFLLILVVLLQCLSCCPALSAALDENTETVKIEIGKATSRLTTDLKEKSSDEKLNDVYRDGKTSIYFKYVNVMKNGLKSK